jgi:hypothetical protein
MIHDVTETGTNRQQKKDTKKPDKGNAWDWADLNPCPLNACCDVWGQCGITPEFCTNSTEDGG